MSESPINRREFLETTREGVAVGVTASLVAGLPDSTWAAALQALDKTTADVLLRMCRVLYPHDTLSDDYYAACVAGLDTKASADADLAKRLAEGAKQLNLASAGKFLNLKEAEQIAVLSAMEDSTFFQTVRGHMVVALYNDRNVWRHFGYEGPSFPLGGYLERGFNDIDWLDQS